MHPLAVSANLSFAIPFSLLLYAQIFIPIFIQICHLSQMPIKIYSSRITSHKQTHTNIEQTKPKKIYK